MSDARLATYTLNLVSIEETHTIDNDPWKRAAEIDHLVDGEGHDSGGQNIILHPRIPCNPQSLCHTEIMGIIFGDILILAPIGAGGRHGGIPRNERVNMRQFPK